MQTQRPIVVVGAGIGGLAAALALLRAGREVVVCEQSGHLGEVGAGLTLSPNGSRAFAALGLADELERIAARPAAAVVRHWRTGEVLDAVDRAAVAAREGAPWYEVHRADLHEALARAVNGVDDDALRLGRALRDFVADEGEVVVRFTNGDSIVADALVGADGARSAVREELLNASPPRYTGYVAWRGLAPAATLPDGAPAGVETFVGPGLALTSLPLRGGQLVHCQAIARQPRWTAESWSTRGSRAELLERFDGFHPTARARLAAVPEHALYHWGLHSREPLLEWSAGRVALLGDAAHPMLPFLGQGAVAALEDAIVLARAFAAGPDAPAALARYERARRERATEVQRLSAEHGHRLLGLDPDRYEGEAGLPDAVAALFGYDAAGAEV